MIFNSYIRLQEGKVGVSSQILTSDKFHLWQPLSLRHLKIGQQSEAFVTWAPNKQNRWDYQLGGIIFHAAMILDFRQCLWDEMIYCIYIYIVLDIIFIYIYICVCINICILYIILCICCVFLKLPTNVAMFGCSTTTISWVPVVWPMTLTLFPAEVLVLGGGTGSQSLVRDWIIPIYEL